MSEFELVSSAVLNTNIMEVGHSQDISTSNIGWYKYPLFPVVLLGSTKVSTENEARRAPLGACEIGVFLTVMESDQGNKSRGG